MTRKGGGFVCQATECGPDEFYYTNEDLTTRCLSQQQASGNLDSLGFTILIRDLLLLEYSISIFFCHDNVILI